VPLLLLPLGRDQAFNAAGVVAHGAGLQLPPTADPTAIAAALRRLLDEPGFRAAAIDAAARIAADAPDRRAADALQRCAHSPQIRPGFHRM
jgi:UDP:flavonoid glycosyltransferase YjiC (YdhE family)